MRPSMIAACLLLALPSSASACFDEHKNAEWLDEKTPSPSWEIAGTSAEGFPGQEALRVGAIAVGSASVALTAVWLPAVFRSRGRRRLKPVEFNVPAPLVLPFDWPSGLRTRIDQVHDLPVRVRPTLDVSRF